MNISKVLKFFVSGGTATAANLFILYFLTKWLGFWYLVSAAVSFLVAFLISFFLQKFWTFDDHRRDVFANQAAAFFATIVAGLVVNSAFLYLLVEYGRLHYLVAQIVSGIGIAAANFFVYEKIIFRRHE